MRFGYSVQRPSIDRAVLRSGPVTLAGEFDEAERLIESIDAAGVRGGGVLADSVVTSGDLSESRLDRVDLSDVVIDGVELSNSSWQSVVARRVEVLRCRALGWRLSLAAASHLYVEGCRLDYATIRVAGANGPVVFANCTFREATISGDLSNVVFQDCLLTGTEFDATAARDCDLRSSDLAGARGLLTLRGAKVDAGQAASVAFQFAAEAGLVVED